MELREQSLTPAEEVNNHIDASAGADARETAIDELAAEAAELPDEEEVAETLVGVETTEAMPATREALMERLKTLADCDACDITAEELGRIKQQFYTLKNDEMRTRREEFIAGGGEPEAWTPEVDTLDEPFKELFNVVKEKKAELRRRQDAEREANLAEKRRIIAEINAIAEDTDNVNRRYNEAKELQEKFLTVGEVPATDASAVWKEYQDAREHFYDQLKVNKELRDYDFKKNLAEKQLICESAEQLNAESDVIIAFRRLQELHDKWREIGPVSKELREELWTRFKDASAAINKRYQAYFEERKARETANEEAKTALCEQVEALDFSTLQTYAAWDEMTKVIMQAQADWKQIGFASRKANNLLFARFRGVCDRFFTEKGAFFKQMKDTLADNLAKKTALADRAEALMESTDWRKTTDELVAMQKQWKQIGAVPKKQSDAVWQRFMKACDTFFDRKKQNTGGIRSAEQANLAAKQEIIDRLKVLADPEGEAVERKAVADELRQLREKWQEIGHVPFKLKDKVYDEYRQLLREVEKRHDVRGVAARRAEFEAGVDSMSGDPNRLGRERERLVRALEARRNDLNTYENNLGFLSSKSKAGESMMREMQRRMERLKEEIESLTQKIKVVDSRMD